MASGKLDFATVVNTATNELQRNVLAVKREDIDVLIEALLTAKKIALYGVGREGLAMKGFAMRMFHLGLESFAVGDMTSGRVGDGDLLLASAGPGYFSTVEALCNKARENGCRVIVFSSRPYVRNNFAEKVVCIPGTCMHEECEVGYAGQSEADRSTSILLMGSSYELTLQLFFDSVCVLLREHRKTSEKDAEQRHTNLE